MTSATPRQSSGTHRASQLLHAVLMLNTTLEHSMCRRLKINHTDIQALQHLMLNEPMTPGELAGRLNISTAATTAVVDRMSQRGHVLRTPHPRDRRSLLIRPSPEAVTQTLETLRPLFDEAENIINALTPSGQDTVVVYLQGILEAMHAQIDAQRPPTINKRNERP